jgi:hypothetical protein
LDTVGVDCLATKQSFRGSTTDHDSFLDFLIDHQKERAALARNSEKP